MITAQIQNIRQYETKMNVEYLCETPIPSNTMSTLELILPAPSYNYITTLPTHFDNFSYVIDIIDVNVASQSSNFSITFIDKGGGSQDLVGTIYEVLTYVNIEKHMSDESLEDFMYINKDIPQQAKLYLYVYNFAENITSLKFSLTYRPLHVGKVIVKTS